MMQETKIRYEIINESIEAKKDTRPEDVFDVLLEQGTKNGYYKTIAIVDSFDEAKAILAKHPITVKPEATYAIWITSADITYAEEQEWSDAAQEWISTGCYEPAPIANNCQGTEEEDTEEEELEPAI